MNGARSIPLNRVLEGVGDIVMGPGDPGWTSKVPPPDKDGSTADALDVLKQAAEAAAAAAPVQEAAPIAAPATKRVAIYCGRGDQFVVAVEEAPDWDVVKSWKHDGPTAVVIQKVLLVLGVKVQDKTGGELDELRRYPTGREEAAASD